MVSDAVSNIFIEIVICPEPPGQYILGSDSLLVKAEISSLDGSFWYAGVSTKFAQNIDLN